MSTDKTPKRIEVCAKPINTRPGFDNGIGSNENRSVPLPRSGHHRWLLSLTSKTIMAVWLPAPPGYGIVQPALCPNCATTTMCVVPNKPQLDTRWSGQLSPPFRGYIPVFRVSALRTSNSKIKQHVFACNPFVRVYAVAKRTSSPCSPEVDDGTTNMALPPSKST